MIRAALVLLVLVSAPAMASEALFKLIDQRLELMQEVAAYKWIKNLPITATEREAVVINNAVIDGLQYGLTKHSSAAFFQAQITAAKNIQQCWHQRWSTEGGPQKARDLNSSVRPALIKLGTDIVALLSNELANEALFNQTVRVECLDALPRSDIYASLKTIRQYPDPLTQIQISGILRVGTTGDYAPFSNDAKNQQPIDGNISARKPTEYRGIDIDLARRLADALGAEVRFVETSWPTLMNDLKTGRYDIAMSGVSNIPSRQTEASFSDAYHVGGKTPISRCEDAAKFTQLSDINRPDVSVIVNPGGTNERFVDHKLTKARKILHPDNRTIFSEIVKGEADIMVTDAIEVALKTQTHPSLCATMPKKTLTHQIKAYMMPKNQRLQHAVNQWLEKERSSGALEATFNRHLTLPLSH
ncbi:MAG: cyclohexadienyl dehydratase [Candidatus Azotimanducaceae bacterium]|jgi:cyclohexadienyl dehydratase